jgi:hypothetical protein
MDELIKIYRNFKRNIKLLGIEKATELLNQAEEEYYLREGKDGKSNKQNN